MTDSASELIGNVFRHELSKDLSTPLKNILDHWADGKPFTMDNVKKAVQTRIFHPKSKGGASRNLGWKRYRELCAWLDIPEPPEHCCPQCGYDLTKKAE